MSRLCEECGKPISKARLVAMPNADLCVRCQARHDVRPLRADDIGENLASLGELTRGEIQRMTQNRGG